MSSPPRLPVLPVLPVTPRRRTWRDEAREAITDLAGLERALRLTDDEREGARRSIASGFPMSITPYYLSLCDPDDAACPIRLQCVPRAQEAVEVKGDLRDPLGEEAHEVAPNLVQRYPDRALLLATDRCSVYCRFCTRRRIVGRIERQAPRELLAEAFAYVRAHDEVDDQNHAKQKMMGCSFVLG